MFPHLDFTNKVNLLLYIGPVTVYWSCYCILVLLLYIGPVAVYWSCYCILVLLLYIGPVTVY